MKWAVALSTVVILALAGCGEPKLRQLRSSDRGPEEFTVIPVKPLQQPSDYATLPLPGSSIVNITDPTPKRDAIAVLGGSDTRFYKTGIPAADKALMRRADRYGTTKSIRTLLAIEDTEFRKRRYRINRFQFRVRDEYGKLYAKETLDAYAELLKFRKVGVATPAVPLEF